jgi:hypothetical protein
MAQGWVRANYPGTKIAFTEYNWGGLESVNGAVAQADVLGIFGKYELDLATLWGPPNPRTQVPGLMAFAMYRNYDGKNSMFGDTALTSNSGDQGELSIYGARRSSDNAATVIVINKTYGPLRSTLSLENLSVSRRTAQVFQYSKANINAIMPQKPVKVTTSARSGTSSLITYTFPAQSVTLFVIPNWKIDSPSRGATRKPPSLSRSYAALGPLTHRRADADRESQEIAALAKGSTAR